VTIVSGTPGTTALTATHDAVVGETSGTYEATAEKHWAAIDLVKTALIAVGEGGLKTVTYSTDPEVETAVITYEYTITNVGPVALTVTSLEDDVLGTITLPVTLVLEPGASHTATPRRRRRRRGLQRGGRTGRCRGRDGGGRPGRRGGLRHAGPRRGEPSPSSRPHSWTATRTATGSSPSPNRAPRS
jgi:hypothetical protein